MFIIRSTAVAPSPARTSANRPSTRSSTPRGAWDPVHSRSIVGEVVECISTSPCGRRLDGFLDLLAGCWLGKNSAAGGDGIVLDEGLSLRLVAHVLGCQRL